MIIKPKPRLVAGFVDPGSELSLVVERTGLEPISLDVKPSGVTLTPTAPRVPGENRKTPEIIV